MFQTLNRLTKNSEFVFNHKVVQNRTHDAKKTLSDVVPTNLQINCDIHKATNVIEVFVSDG